MNIAAIDCGTNSIRLLVAAAALQEGRVHLEELSRQMRIVRLGEGVDRNGALSEGAIARTLAAVEEYRQIMEQFDVGAVDFIATSAMRDASNGQQLIDRVHQILGVTPKVVPGTEEAALSFMGATAALSDLPRPALVVDIGGGSTEFVFGADEVQASRSINMGSVRLTERFDLNGAEGGSQESLEAARQWIRAQLKQLQDIIPVEEVESVVGVAGTVTTLAAYSLGVGKYDPAATHGQFLSWEQWEASADYMITASVAEKARLEFMPPGRADVIAGGALVWQEVLRWIQEGTRNQPVDSTRARLAGAYVSERDILDGIAFSVAYRSLLQ